MSCRLATLVGSLVLAAPASAVDLEVQVRTNAGTLVRDAVVTLHLVGRPTPMAPIGGGYVVDQRNLQFQPFVTIVPVGSSATFPNHDSLRHHVYSFSPVKRFELRIDKRQQNRAVVFDKPGVVPLGCNIHDRMIAFIHVVDTAWAAKTDASGRAAFRDLPPGKAMIGLWHPYLRAPRNHVRREVALTRGQGRREAFAVALRAPPRPPALSDY